MADNADNDGNGGALAKQLRLFDVYALATGATLSAGLFLLPGIAAAQAGPAIVFCYLLAAIPLVPAMLSVVELSTAMPRAGGAYYFLDRSLGPLAGTIGGLGTWLALVLKTSFALVGMGAYVGLFTDATPMTMRLVAVAFAVAFGVVNLYGAEKSGRFQIVFVVCLLVILALFIGRGVPAVELDHFRGFFGAGQDALLSTAGMVYISYVGVTKVASVSEEVRDPERNLPLGIFLSLATAILVYGLVTFVLVGVVPMDELAGDLTPMASAAERLVGAWGVPLISIAALIAFASVANAGILSASRYPLAMSRDHLLPAPLGRLSARGTPGLSIVVTVAAILALLLLLDPAKIAKFASAFQLLVFALLCLAVIVMRESKIESYDPGFRSPLYPWMQIVGIVAPFVLIAEMGWLPTLFSAAMIVVAIAWYFWYAAKHVRRHGAIFHVFARLGEVRHHDLDRELRTILKEKGLRDQDPFDHIVLDSVVLDVEEVESFERLIESASARLEGRVPCDRETLVRGFTEGTAKGATPVAKGVALPHMRLEGLEGPQMVLVRCRRETRIATADVFGTRHEDTVHAVFFLVSPENDPGQHLRMLAQLATRIDQDDFLGLWLAAEDEVHLKEIFLRDDRSISIRLREGSSAEEMIGRAIREIDLPDGTLVAAVRRNGATVVPHGSTRLAENDRLLIIGEPDAIRVLYARHAD